MWTVIVEKTIDRGSNDSMVGSGGQWVVAVSVGNSGVTSATPDTLNDDGSSPISAWLLTKGGGIMGGSYKSIQWKNNF